MVEKNRFRELDGLRGIAALWVVIYHLVGRPYGYWPIPPALAASISPANINLQGLYAVHLFFIISGFVIFMTIQRMHTLFDFAASRFARLYPAFWTSVIATAVIATAFPNPIQKLTLNQILINLSMLHLYLRVPSVDPVYWSLAFEVGFYVLIAIVFATGLIQKIEILGFIWVTLSFIFLRLFPNIGEDIPWRLQAATGLPFASLFFAGIIFYKIWSDKVTLGRVALLLLCYLTHIFNQSPTMMLILTAIFIAFGLCVAGYGTALASRPLVFLGSISYSLYLIHGTLGYRIQLFSYTIGLPPFLNLLVAISTTICAATMITFLVERPANRAILTIYRRLRSRSIDRFQHQGLVLPTPPVRSGRDP